jgi:hypothetical protein
MRNPFIKITLALVVLGVIGLAAPAHALVDVQSSPDNFDKFRTGGAGAAVGTQLNAVTAQFGQITRVFRGCSTGGGVKDDGSGCDGAGHGRLADFWVIQGVLRNSAVDPNGLGVPNGPSLGEVTYRISGNGASTGLTCARDPASPGGPPGPVGFLAPEGFDGIPNTPDDAGSTFGGTTNNWTFGTPGPGTNPNSATMIAPPLVNCQNKTKLDTYELVSGTTNSYLSGTNTELCVVNFDLNGNGSIQNDQAGAGLPGALTNLTSASASNESTNLKLSCDTAVAAPPPGDFNPPQNPFLNQDITGAQIYKIAASRDVHSINGGNDAKLHLALPQLEGIFGELASNSVCRLNHIGAASTSASQNVTACIRSAGSGAREVFRLTFMSNTEGSKTQSEDPSGVENGTVTTCVQTKEGGGSSQIASKRVKLNSLITDQVNCLDTFSGSFTYLDADRFDPGIYAPVVEGVDPDAAILAPAGQTLKDLVKCGAYRYWGPLASGIGGRNPSGTPYITAHLGALKKPAVYAAGNAYLPLPAIGFSKTSTDGAYTIAFVPTTCPGAPPAEIPISATPNSSP